MSKLEHNVEVEPLSDLRLARVEKRVLAELRSAPGRRRASGLRPSWAIGAAAVVAAAALAAVLLTAPDEAAPTFETMPVWVRADDGAPSRLQVGEALVTVGPGARVAVGQDRDGVTVQLDGGWVDCELPPRPGAAPRFAVLAGDVTVRVVGTQFRVDRDGDAVDVSVARGKVEVIRGEERVAVAAGESWSTGGEVLAAAGRARNDEASARSAGAGGSEPDDGAAMPDSERPEAGAPPAAPGRGSRPDGGSTRKHGATEAPAASPATEDETVRESVAELRRQAALRTGESAADALYRAVRRLSDAGDHIAVVRTALEYDKRFPNHGWPRAEAVLWMRIEALLALNNESGARAAAHTYLRRYPRGAHASEATRILRR